MYSTSSQKREWTFKSEEEINEFRVHANRLFIQKYGANMSDEKIVEYFLTPEEELILLKNSEHTLRDFCKKFSPPMLKCVVGTAFHYFKRFYVHNSVMDYHPKEILVTCAYLACKIEEFNVSIQQFVANVKGDREKAAEIILSNELLLMHKLNYFLTVHNPVRPVEGFLIDIKTRFPQLGDPERLRPGIEDFLERVMLTDACLLYSPSQIGLASILHAASNLQENLDQYVTDTLFGMDGTRLMAIVDIIRHIRFKVKTMDLGQRENVRQLEEKLARCRNQENNPDSEIYKRRMLDILNAEDEGELARYNEAKEEESALERRLTGISR